MPMREACLSFFILLFISCSHSAFAADFFSQHSIDLNLPVSIPRTIQYSFILENKTNALLPKAELRVYGPVEKTSSQQVAKLSCSHPFTTMQDDLGNRILLFTFNDLPPYSSRIVTVKSQLLIFKQPLLNRAEELQRFIQPEPFVESNHPEIVRLAAKLTKDEPKMTVRSIFDWVVRNIEYSGYASSPRGALYTIRNRKGDCTEYMTIFVALCRAADIPARGMGGYVVAEDTVLKPADYHNWAEFYEDGIWKIADPQKKIFAEDRQDYIATRIISNSDDNSLGSFGRFAFQGEGLAVVMIK